MGRESANYWLELPPGADEAFVQTLDRAGAERTGSDDARIDYRVRDPNRYWIDVRIHRGPQSRLEIRIALTNDTWAIREPLEQALTPLPPAVVGLPLRDEQGKTITVAGAERWWYTVEEHYGALRDEFVAAVGDFTAPLSPDHVYGFLHQARTRQNATESAEKRRETEIEMLEDMWDADPAVGKDVDPPP